MSNLPKKTVKVVVLGDIGRSPRMQYHALSLAQNGLKVKLLGYTDSTPLPEILAHPDITIVKLNSALIDKGPQMFRYAIKAIWQTISLFLTLFISGGCDYLLCQNPPAIPTLPICRFYCSMTRTKFIIDWHNYAYSIMALSIPNDHLLLKVSKFIEMYYGQAADHNLCVTSAMKADLLNNWDVIAKVLYDRPPKIFRTLTLQEKHDWFLKLGQQYSEFRPKGTLNAPDDTSSTIISKVVNNEVQLTDDRPGILFSSTSWTVDEDFDLLIDALQVYETTHDVTKRLPKLICVITGKGPMKEYFLEDISTRDWKNVKVVTPWLEASDYPKMVASADLGVCLHASSSGLDLPMKVVDMFGAGLPVCAIDFNCIGELVENEVNGYTFTTSDELARRIVEWFTAFPNNEAQNKIAEEMRQKIAKFRESRWEENWNTRVKKIFQE